MFKTCRQCAQQFEITDEDLKFYDRISPVFGEKKYIVSPPALCPDCRQQKRLAFRNEIKLYHRNCDLTGKSVISVYSTDKPYTVYEHKEWWSDKWDPLQYNQVIDFSRPFFEQFAELFEKIPHIAMMISDKNENSDYCPYSVGFKNSYMCISGVYSENCYYCFWINDSKDCMDSYACFKCELCYECVDCLNLYYAIYCLDCENSSNLAFCQDCRGCKNCIGCYGLRNKEYYVFNQKFSKEEFEKIWRKLKSGGMELQNIEKRFNVHSLKFPRPVNHFFNTENCSGDYLKNCNNSHDCYDSLDLEDCAYLWNIPFQAKDCHDANYSPGTELGYNCLSCVKNYHAFCSAYCWDASNIFYCYETFYSKDCFGCVGLKNKQYCILNKQYTKEGYEKFVQKIIDHMKKTNEWGEFFPFSIAPFAYNETIAQDYFPATKNATLRLGGKWKEDDSGERQRTAIVKISEYIGEITDDITRQIFGCESCGRPYKIILAELKFYQKMQLPLPVKCFYCRHKHRMDLRNPHKLWERKCMKCNEGIKTSYAPERPEIVYCEKCYLKEVY